MHSFTAVGGPVVRVEANSIPFLDDAEAIHSLLGVVEGVVESAGVADPVIESNFTVRAAWRL